MKKCLAVNGETYFYGPIHKPLRGNRYTEYNILFKKTKDFNKDILVISRSKNISLKNRDLSIFERQFMRKNELWSKKETQQKSETCVLRNARP